MSITEQITKAQNFLFLHNTGKLLILPNVWNPIGARVLESKGYPAVATASAAIAESLGYADGENLRFETMLEMLTRIVRSVNVPVTADIEAGYASTVSELKDSIHEVLKTGVVGINIEDSLVEGVSMRPVTEQCERIAAVRDAADQYGVHLVINARVDSFFLDSLGAGQEKLEDAVARADAYAEAGADCIYPIGPGDRETVSLLRQQIAAPLNILAMPNAVSLTDLQRLNINRVSFGPFIFRSLLAKFVHIVEELKDLGPYSVFAEQSITGKDVAKFLISGKE